MFSLAVIACLSLMAPKASAERAAQPAIDLLKLAPPDAIGVGFVDIRHLVKEGVITRLLENETIGVGMGPWRGAKPREILADLGTDLNKDWEKALIVLNKARNYQPAVAVTGRFDANTIYAGIKAKSESYLTGLCT